MRFKDRFGPWAIIAGASQGIGRAFAERIAGEGVNCILVSRSEGPLAALAADLAERHGVECLAFATDLSSPDSAARVLDFAGDREIGLFVNNAGADSVGLRFLEAPLEDWIRLADLNIATSLRFGHAIGTAMKARGRGGIVLVGSGACYGGSQFMSVYSGAKAFQMAFAEGLWSELRPHGVDVLYCALGPTDTPAFRDLLARKGVPPLPGLADPAEVAATVLGQLGNGPVYNWGQADEDAGYLPMSAAQRRQRVQMVEMGTKRIYGD